MSNGYEWAHTIVWNKERIEAFKKDIERLKHIQFNIFFTQKARSLVGYDKADKLMHDLRAFYSIISKISYNNANERNIDILINAAGYWKPAEVTLNKIKKICSHGEKAPFKYKMNKYIDDLLKIKRFIGDAEKFSQVKRQWLLHGLIAVPIALVVITMLFLLLTHTI